MDFFQANSDLLARTDPLLAGRIKNEEPAGTIEIVRTAESLPIPVVHMDGKKLPLHSRVNPLKESERFIDEVNTDEYDLYIVFGLGFAYHVECLLGRIHSDSVVVVVEKSIDVIRSCMTERDMSSIFCDNRFLLLHDPDEDSLAEKLKGRSSRRVTFLTHRGSYQVYTDYYRNMLRVCRSYISTKEVNIATLAKFEKTWSANIARNILCFLDSPGIGIFFDKFKNVPAIVAAAGPSLTDSISFIHENSNRALIIAVDTSWRILRKAGITPHFCVSVDPQLINARYFEGMPGSGTVLISDPTVHPSVFRLFGGKAAVAGIAFPMMKWLEEYGGARGDIAHGGSVSTNAYDFARRLGASPVIMVGQDLAFTRGLAHARGSYLDEQMFLRTGRFRTAEMINRGQLRALPPLYVKGILTEKVQTNQKMMIFLSWFSHRNDENLVNCTYDGSRIPSVNHTEMKDMNLPERELSIQSMIREIMGEAAQNLASASSRRALRRRIREMENDVDELVLPLERAVNFSASLKDALAEKDQSKIDYILRRLDDTDRMLESRTAVKDMIGFTVQRVIHTITEGYDTSESEKGLADDVRVAERSQFLYRGFLEGALFIRRTLSRMDRILAGAGY